ncbi:MAG: LysR family transcriptional regulator [Gloeomargaritaceae cyanobacterium C42_A2020_066]|nr:LysR family transcriptional regulator [Gloeomargaritaceae cyanobacterium C42_A2020_066]
MRAFTQVVTHRGFAAAGRQMGLSRSAVNKLVAQLEQELGIQLLHRTTRLVQPTEAGRAFYERCLDILNDVAEAEQAVAQLQAEPRGVLRLNAPMSFGVLHLSPLLAEFMAHYAQVAVRLTLEDRFVDPIAEGYDLVVRIGPPVESASLIVQAVTTVHQIICAAPVYLKAHPVPSHPHELTEHVCLEYGYQVTGSAWHLTAGSEILRVPVAGRFCANNGQVLRDAALQGLGLALLPHFIVASDLAAGRLVPLLTDYPPPTTQLSVLYPVNRHLSVKVRLLIDWLEQRFGQAEL